jgi:dihydroorotate dehydrogenase electron transfer subunit
MLQVTAEIVARSGEGAAAHISLQAPQLAQALAPGRAILLQTGWQAHPFLRRTFYPIAYDEQTVTVRVSTTGDWGHAWLRSVPIGTTIDCLGPIGNGFGVPPSARNLLYVGEGDMAWTLLPALQAGAGMGRNLTVAFTGRSSQAVPASRLPPAAEYHLAVAANPAARVHQFRETLLPLLQWSNALFAAGNLDFYQWLAPLIRDSRYVLTRAYAQVLHPAKFFCGVGACQACAADVAGGRRRVCLRGPVFDLLDVVP